MNPRGERPAADRTLGPPLGSARIACCLDRNGTGNITTGWGWSAAEGLTSYGGRTRCCDRAELLEATKEKLLPGRVARVYGHFGLDGLALQKPQG